MSARANRRLTSWVMYSAMALSGVKAAEEVLAVFEERKKQNQF